MSAFITKQVTFSKDHPSRCKCQECRHQRVNHDFVTSVNSSTKSTTNFDSSGSTELTRSHHNVRDQRLLVQGTNKDASRCTGSVASDAGNQSPEQVGKKESCEKLARNQRGTLRISWNIVCKLVVIRFVQSVDSTFCTVSRGFKLGIVYQFPAKTTTNEQFPIFRCCVRVFCHHITQLCCRVTPAYY